MKQTHFMGYLEDGKTLGQSRWILFMLQLWVALHVEVITCIHRSIKYINWSMDIYPCIRMYVWKYWLVWYIGTQWVMKPRPHPSTHFHEEELPFELEIISVYCQVLEQFLNGESWAKLYLQKMRNCEHRSLPVCAGGRGDSSNQGQNQNFLWEEAKAWIRD